MDARDMASGIQFTAKGGDNKTMSHCDKGKIQQAVHLLRLKNFAAWSWGMWAYAPEGTENSNVVKNALLDYAFSAARTDKLNPYLVARCGHIAYVAMQDAAVEARTQSRYKRHHKEMAAMLRCSVDDYRKDWMPVFFKMKDALKDLDGVALPPIGNVIWVIIDKNSGDESERANAVVDLQRMMRRIECAD